MHSHPGLCKAFLCDAEEKFRLIDQLALSQSSFLF